MPIDLMLSPNSTVVAAGEQTSCRLGDETVVLSLNAGVYYGLNPVAARVWELVRQPRTVDEILGILLEEYDVDVEGCRRDLLALLHEFVGHDLIKVENDGSS
jgi:hypothetical protein